jgi:uncharacterized protein
VIAMNKLHLLTFPLIIVGALNWGLVGLFDFNLVSAIVGTWPAVEKIIYILVGLSAFYELAMHKTFCKNCRGELVMK